jgi:hypothetical protein
LSTGVSVINNIMDFLKLVAELGFPIAAAFAAGDAWGFFPLLTPLRSSNGETGIPRFPFPVFGCFREALPTIGR